MKNMIGKGVIIAAAFYLILMVIETILHPEVLIGAVIGAVLLAGLASVFFWKNEHRVHTGEVIVLWVMVLAFFVYGLVFFIGGML